MIKKGTTIEAVRNVIEESKGIIFVYKHSSSCPISHTALRQVEKFSNNHEDILIVFLEVHNQRELSNAVEAQYDVRHESPQLLTFKDWVYKEVHNHLAVSARYMNHVVWGGRNKPK